MVTVYLFFAFLLYLVAFAKTHQKIRIYIYSFFKPCWFVSGLLLFLVVKFYIFIGEIVHIQVHGTELQNVGSKMTQLFLHQFQCICRIIVLQ